MIRTRNARRGFSIIEIVLVMGGVSIILGLCAGLLHVMLRLDRAGRSHMTETATIGRVARQFRQDVRASTRAERGGDDGPASKLGLVLAEGRNVDYRTREHLLIRTEHKGESVVRRETYTFPFCRAPQFRIHDVDGKVWVSLRLPRGAETSPSSLRHVLSIDALVGRDHRLSRPREEEALP